MKSFRFKKRYKIILGIVLLLAVVLFSAPRIGCWYIVKHSHELVGRRMEIEKIRFNYFSGTLRINDLRIFESDSEALFFSFKKLQVNLDYLPLLRNEFYIKSITVDDPFTQVLQNGDKFNFSDLVTSDTTKVVADTVPEQPTKYIINNIEINRGNIKYTDIPLNHTIALRNVDLKIPGFTWNSDSTRLDIDFRFVDGGRFYSSLELNQADSTYLVNLKLDSLNLDIIEPYLQSNMYISSLHGYLTNDLLIKGNMRSVMELFVRGVNHIYGFQLTDTLNRKIFTSEEITVDIDTLQLDKNRVRLKYIGLTDPFILLEMVDSTNNWLSLIKPSAEEPADSLQQADTSDVTAEGSFSFSKLKITGGKVLFSDKTLRYPFEYNIDRLIIESTALPGSGDKLSVKVSAGLNGTGDFSANATLDQTDFNDFDLSLSVSQFRMKDVDSYFRHYFGFPVTGGRLNFSTENRMSKESLVSTNNIYFKRFTLDKQTEGEREYNIPLRLALGILSDKDGIIDLKAPVEMKGEDIRVRNLGKIILRVVGNLFVKAAVSPFNLLGDLFSADPAKLQEIHLITGEASPDKPNMESVDILADVLTKRPALAIDFIYCINHDKTRDTLARILANEDYLHSPEVKGQNIKAVPDNTLSRYILGKMAIDSLAAKNNITDLCRRYIGEEKLGSVIDSMKQVQTGFLKNYISVEKEIPDNRFRIIETMPDSIRYENTDPAFRVYFTSP